MSLKNIEYLLTRGEGTEIEFKESAESERIINTIVAFANGSGGSIVIGIRDGTREVVGIENPEDIEEKLTNKISDLITPSVLPTIYTTSYKNKSLVVIVIYPSPGKPFFVTKGKRKTAYIRIGASTRPADDMLIESLKRPNYDREPYHSMKYTDIDLNAALSFFPSFPLLERDGINNLVSLGILSKYSGAIVPSVGGAILFGKDRLRYFPAAMIVIGIIQGEDIESSPRTQSLTSFLPQAISEALNFIKDNIGVSMKVDGLYHRKIWEVPELALREALVNAVVHNDYNLQGAPIKVIISSDKIVIENNAVLMAGFTFEDLKKQISIVRNHVIARFFKEIGLIEQWGTGITKMITSCVEMGLPDPRFEQIGSRIRVTFSRKKEERDGKEGVVIIDDTEAFIIELIKLCDPLSTHDIARAVGKSKRSVVDKLRSLVMKGELVEIGSSPKDPTKVYNVKTEQNNMMKNSLTLAIQFRHDTDSWYVFLKLHNFRLNLIFRADNVDDFIMDDSRKYIESAKKALENIVLSEPSIKRAIINGLADENTQNALKKQKLANILIVPYYRNMPDDENLRYWKKHYKADACSAFPLQSIYGFRSRKREQ